jgi:hypothetical protein
MKTKSICHSHAGAELGSSEEEQTVELLAIDTRVGSDDGEHLLSAQMYVDERHDCVVRERLLSDPGRCALASPDSLV